MRHTTICLLVAALCALLPGPAQARGFQARGFSDDLSPEARKISERSEQLLVEFDLPAAEKEFARLVDLAPDFAKGYYRYSFVTSATRATETRKTLADRYRSLTAAEPDRAAYWYALALFTADDGERVAATDRVIALAPNEPWGYLSRAWNRKDMPFEERLALVERARSLAADEPLTSYLLAVLYFSEARTHEDDPTAAEYDAKARSVFDRLMASAPKSYETAALMPAFLSRASGQERIRLAETYIERFPSGSFAGRVYFYILEDLRERDPAAAARRGREVMQQMRAPHQGRDRDLIFQEFVVRQVEQQGADALAQLSKEFRTVNEASPEIFRLVAVSLTNTGERQELVVPILEHALALLDTTPRSAEYRSILLMDLAGAHKRAGAPKRAAEILESITSSSNAVVLDLERGEVYTMLGEHQKAYAAYVRARAVDPSEGTAKRLAEAAKAVNRSPEAVDEDVWTARYAVAKEAPDFTLQTLDGKSFTLSSLRGKVVLLNFWFPT